jgi:hypothetical protein
MKTIIVTTALLLSLITAGLSYAQWIPLPAPMPRPTMCTTTCWGNPPICNTFCN